MYYREAVGALLVYDLTGQESLEAVPYWKADLDKHLKYDDGNFPVMLIGNKSDIADDIPEAKMKKYAKENGYVDFYATSAKENVNVTEAIHALVDSILNDLDKVRDDDSDTVNVNQNEPKSNESGCC